MDFAGRPLSCKVVPIFGENDCFVILPGNCLDGVMNEAKLRGGPGVVVVEIEHNGAYSYATWNHRQAQDRGLGGCGNGLGVPVAFLKELGLAADEIVNIKCHVKVQQAKEVHVVPAGVDDSEIIEHNQGRLEDLILKQLRVVYEGQIVPIYVRKGVTVRIRTTKITKPSSHQTKQPVVTLGDGTELIVETKMRQKTQPDVKKPMSATLRIVVGGEKNEGKPYLKVSREILTEKNWVPDTTLPCITYSDIAIASWEAGKAVSESALRRHTFDVTIKVHDLKGDGVVTNLSVPVGSMLLVDPSLTSSGVHQELFGRGNTEDDGGSMVEEVASVQGEAWKEVQKILNFMVSDGKVFNNTKNTRVGSLAGSVLITGAAGVGKSKILDAVEKESTVFTVRHEEDIATEGKGEIDVKLKGIERSFLIAAVNAPSVLLIDDLDTLIGEPPEQGKDVNLDMLASLFLDLMTKHDLLSTAPTYTPSGVTIIATAINTDKVNPTISPAFSNVIKVTLPGASERESIARTSLHREGFTPQKGVLPHLSRETNNYTPRDITALCHKASHHARVARQGGVDTISWSDFSAAMGEFTPASLTGINMYKPEDLSWGDVGGLEEVKKTFDETVILPTKYPELYEKLPIKMRSGILLYGPTGCGKSHVVACAVAEAGLNCIQVSGPELLNKYIGQSEQRVREVFEQAQSAAPCILFFDEFDSIAPQRGHDNTGVTDRVVNQLLCHLDGAEGRSGVYVVAATARPDMIDKALLRPGRLDVQVLCDMPDVAEREKVLVAASKNLKLSPEVDLATLAGETKGFTSADLASLLSTARLQCIQEVVDTSTALAKMNIDGLEQGGGDKKTSPWDSLNHPPAHPDDLDTYIADLGLAASSGANAVTPESKVPIVTPAVLVNALKSTRPSISAKDAAKNKQIYDKYKEARGGGAKDKPKGQRTTMA